MSLEKRVIIIGAGPAGLTAAYEFLKKTDIKPIVFEQGDTVGGISKTINYKGYRMDIGGHRFFSKSDVVMNWWLDILPIDSDPSQPITISYQKQTRKIDNNSFGSTQLNQENVMLVRSRKSRIFFLRKLFDYPISLSQETIFNLGILRTLQVILSYLRVKLFPIKNESNLEEFFINRFGKLLYQTFFKSYTEKVWGVPCTQISSEWGAQRIKGLSITKTAAHILKKTFRLNSNSISQKGTETSLIEQFLYPKYGPGQLWEEVAKQILEMGGEIHLNSSAECVVTEGYKVVALDMKATNSKEQPIQRVSGDYFISTMPIQELIRNLKAEVPQAVREISEGLIYRDFITVGLLVEKLALTDAKSSHYRIKDNWIYVQEPDVLLGRIQIFNNWSPALVADPSKTWLGLEYFCYETDPLWQMAEAEMADFAIDEMEKLGFIRKADVLDHTVVKVPKTYPAYFGTYENFDQIRAYLDRFENLYLIGRNGMHRYNNQDHSMLTAMAAVDNIRHNLTTKSNIWEINTEQDYHEAKDAQGKVK